MSILCETITCFFVLEIEMGLNFLFVGLNLVLGMGNISTFEWPPKPSYASSGFAATEEFGLP